MNTDSTHQEVRAAIDELYRVFRPYKALSTMGYCSCCIREEEVVELTSAPLHEVRLDLLNRYADKAVTTWGDVNELKHFLPRIFEAMVFERSAWLGDIEIACSKLAYTDWWSWPAIEQEAIMAFAHAWWRYELAHRTPMYEGYRSRICDTNPRFLRSSRRFFYAASCCSCSELALRAASRASMVA